jgi:hypothetical protein
LLPALPLLSPDLFARLQDHQVITAIARYFQHPNLLKSERRHLLLLYLLPLIFCLQDHQVITAIASYFQHPIPEVAWNNEDQFISVLNKAGLTDQTA